MYLGLHFLEEWCIKNSIKRIFKWNQLYRKSSGSFPFSLLWLWWVQQCVLFHMLFLQLNFDTVPTKERDLCSFHLNLVVSGSDTLWLPMLNHKRWLFYFLPCSLGTLTQFSHHSVRKPKKLVERYTWRASKAPVISHVWLNSQQTASTNLPVMWVSHLGSDPIVLSWADATWSRDEPSTQITVQIEGMKAQ